MKVEEITARSVSAAQEPSRRWAQMRLVESQEQAYARLVKLHSMYSADLLFETWENDAYYCSVRRHSAGFALGGGPYVVIGITASDESARHDWRDFQRIKNDIVGPEWEAVELYPAESRLKDPSNRFYLWCAPKGVFEFGLSGGRIVCGPESAIAPQRPFGEPWPTYSEGVA